MAEHIEQTEKRKRAKPLPEEGPPEGATQIETLPWVPIMVEDEDGPEGEASGFQWPPFVSVPPLPGDRLAAVGGLTTGESPTTPAVATILSRVHRWDLDFGSILVLIVRIQ